MCEFISFVGKKQKTKNLNVFRVTWNKFVSFAPTTSLYYNDNLWQKY